MKKTIYGYVGIISCNAEVRPAAYTALSQLCSDYDIAERTVRNHLNSIGQYQKGNLLVMRCTIHKNNRGRNPGCFMPG